MKKKLLSALLSVAMISSLLVGCGSSADTTETTETTATTEATPVEAPAAEQTTEEASD